MKINKVSLTTLPRNNTKGLVASIQSVISGPKFDHSEYHVESRKVKFAEHSLKSILEKK